MKFSALTFILAAAGALAAPSSPPPAKTVQVTYSGQYDNPKMSLNGVACSNGPTGMENKGFTVLGQLPGFPNVGGAFVVGGWGSPECGTCWKLTYKDKSINILALDHSADGTFNIAEGAMNKLTGGQAVNLGRVTATYEQVPLSAC